MYVSYLHTMSINYVKQKKFGQKYMCVRFILALSIPLSEFVCTYGLQPLGWGYAWRVEMPG